MPNGIEQICKRCVMDATDPLISFDEKGFCNHCRRYEEEAKRILRSPLEREQALEKLVDNIKQAGKGKEYDCVIGVSGGVDSTYVAYLVKQLGLRPLAMHVDNGWNSELSVGNIEKCLKKLGIDLYTEVLDWNEFKELQKAFLRASVPDGEIPTDHAIRATLYHQAVKRGVSYLVLGTNFVTESIMPHSWSAGHGDWRYIRFINQRFGKKPLKTFPHFSLFDQFRYLVIHRLRIISILDYVDYNKEEIIQLLKDELGWTPYPGKHYESIYTRFFQGYVLPAKFGYDKRKAHLSTLIMSGQITRDEALKGLKDLPLSGQMLEEDMDFVLKKFDLEQEEFEAIMALPPKSYNDYPNQELVSKIIKKTQPLRFIRDIGLVPKKEG